jgi:hypothetical protein
MDITEARRIVQTIPADAQTILSAAHDRYMHFAGVYTGDDVPASVVAEDLIRFAHLLVFSECGRPSLSDVRCADFMEAITSLPRDWCLAWDEFRFAEEHGEDFVEKQRRRAEQLRLAAEAGVDSIHQIGQRG